MLAEYKADFQPKDQTIFLKEWLQYAVERVPTLFTEVQTRTFNGRGTTAHFGQNAEAMAKMSPGLQQPSLFDFRKAQQSVVVSRIASVTGS